MKKEALQQVCLCRQVYVYIHQTSLSLYLSTLKPPTLNLRIFVCIFLFGVNTFFIRERKSKEKNSFFSCQSRQRIRDFRLSWFPSSLLFLCMKDCKLDSFSFIGHFLSVRGASLECTYIQIHVYTPLRKDSRSEEKMKGWHVFGCVYRHLKIRNAGREWGRRWRRVSFASFLLEEKPSFTSRRLYSTSTFVRKQPRSDKRERRGFPSSFQNVCYQERERREQKEEQTEADDGL